MPRRNCYSLSGTRESGIGDVSTDCVDRAVDVDVQSLYRKHVGVQLEKLLGEETRWPVLHFRQHHTKCDCVQGVRQCCGVAGIIYSCGY